MVVGKLGLFRLIQPLIGFIVLGSALGGLARPTPQGSTPKGYLTAMNEALVITEKV